MVRGPCPLQSHCLADQDDGPVPVPVAGTLCDPPGRYLVPALLLPTLYRANGYLCQYGIRASAVPSIYFSEYFFSGPVFAIAQFVPSSEHCTCIQYLGTGVPGKNFEGTATIPGGTKTSRYYG